MTLSECPDKRLPVLLNLLFPHVKALQIKDEYQKQQVKQTFWTIGVFVLSTCFHLWFLNEIFLNVNVFCFFGGFFMDIAETTSSQGEMGSDPETNMVNF